MSEKNASPLPLSPHLSVWRFTVTMAASITHRATGAALYAGTLLLTAWLASAAYSDAAFRIVTDFLGSIAGLVILAGYSWAICFHLINGVRFLCWDAGHGFDKDVATITGWVSYIGSVILACSLWIIALKFGV